MKDFKPLRQRLHELYIRSQDADADAIIEAAARLRVQELKLQRLEEEVISLRCPTSDKRFPELA